MYFPVAGIEVSPWVPPLVAMAVSFFTSMGGVSGAFLLLPFQMSFLGYASPSVSATNHLFNIVAIPSGVLRYLREGRMVWPLTWIVIAGTLPGVLIGAVVRVTWLPDASNFKLFAGAVLLYIGIKMVRDLTGRSNGSAKAASEHRFQELVRKHRSKAGSGEPLPVVRTIAFNLRRTCYEFYGERHDVSTPGIFALSFFVGIVGGTYGIGGGSIVAPFFVTVFGLPIYTVAGAALMGTFVTSVAGVAFYQFLAPFHPDMAVGPDWLLGILFGLGGMVGMYLGARCQKHVPAQVIKWMLAVVVLGTALKYGYGALF
ncbi:sulfite exporter TauE/SafE family protein [Pseudodesulfovibrio pelocollis]|uniref:sulfite exporter TauE/SafE family protein n=1 Tax=Pseudodesulfovibrio pelocollis TaxID=3051432 RepID=UPI00255AEB78|nr:sulfite exporter TauE/SafE family protein [Pseudodesulfovibrio sp. SB368]